MLRRHTRPKRACRDTETSDQERIGRKEGEILLRIEAPLPFVPVHGQPGVPLRVPPRRQPPQRLPGDQQRILRCRRNANRGRRKQANE